MNIEESKQQLETLIEAWQLNEADLNQTDIEAIKCLLEENKKLRQRDTYTNIVHNQFQTEKKEKRYYENILDELDLWIRSQNKIGNYKSDAQVIRRIGYEDKKEEFAILNNDNISELLGTYKTKERALEVLDEIEKIIYINKLFNADIGAFQTVLKNEGYTEKEISEFLKKYQFMKCQKNRGRDGYNKESNKVYRTIR